MDADEAFYSAIELLKQMISIPSFSRNEGDVATEIERYVQDVLGLFPRRQGNNLFIQTPYSNKKPTILLNSHIDTVKPVSGWQHDPFSPSLEENRLFGLGSNDAGASVVALLHSFVLLTQREQPYNLIFAASAEEEVSGKNGIESLLSNLPPVDFALVGEPTGMQPAIAEKGLLVIDGTVRGKAGHAARNEGENAIYKALTVIEKLKEFHFSRISEFLGAVKISITQIQAGTQHNVIPDRCDFVMDVRTNDLYSNPEAFDLLQQSVPECELKARSFRLNSSHIDVNHPFVQRCILTGMQPFGSPTLSDQALMPFPSVKIGPGDSARSHTADEFILLDEVREAITLYTKLLDGLSLV
ncbi:MAG TPA: M20 family metallo-hydrolase [Candidatus Gallibacteroides avistercoris]|uniref:M20 family metallo-hydrolase n=1 Tax=Candidatus Gallibacteroides avistercoris TaxID=2840833 RepID=A0A9D1M6U1_9BACT|nr:M20 family metallo-hydrolase [Candidatus Gallibacteroides avistercoris]